MNAPKTTLVAGAPWPHTYWPMVQDAEPASKHATRTRTGTHSPGQA